MDAHSAVTYQVLAVWDAKPYAIYDAFSIWNLESDNPHVGTPCLRQKVCECCVNMTRYFKKW